MANGADNRSKNGANVGNNESSSVSKPRRTLADWKRDRAAKASNGNNDESGTGGIGTATADTSAETPPVVEFAVNQKPARKRTRNIAGQQAAPNLSSIPTIDASYVTRNVLGLVSFAGTRIAGTDEAAMQPHEREFIGAPLTAWATRANPAHVGMIAEYADPVCVVIGLGMYLDRCVKLRQQRNAGETFTSFPEQPAETPDTRPTFGGNPVSIPTAAFADINSNPGPLPNTSQSSFADIANTIGGKPQ